MRSQSFNAHSYFALVKFKMPCGLPLKTLLSVKFSFELGLYMRFIIQNRLERVEQLKEFDLGGYWFDATSSTEKEFVFKRDINE